MAEEDPEPFDPLDPPVSPRPYDTHMTNIPHVIFPQMIRWIQLYAEAHQLGLKKAIPNLTGEEIDEMDAQQIAERIAVVFDWLEEDLVETFHRCWKYRNRIYSWLQHVQTHLLDNTTINPTQGIDARHRGNLEKAKERLLERSNDLNLIRTQLSGYERIFAMLSLLAWEWFDEDRRHILTSRLNLGRETVKITSTLRFCLGAKIIAVKEVLAAYPAVGKEPNPDLT